MAFLHFSTCHLTTDDILLYLSVYIGEQNSVIAAPVQYKLIFSRVFVAFASGELVAYQRVVFLRWLTWTYAEYLRDVRTAAKAFIKLGLPRFSGVCILGFNSPEWFIADYAAIFAG
jgi:long-chain-fatty-acid--CoA ligase ACSBG